EADVRGGERAVRAQQPGQRQPADAAARPRQKLPPRKVVRAIVFIVFVGHCDSLPGAYPAVTKGLSALTLAMSRPCGTSSRSHQIFFDLFLSLRLSSRHLRPGEERSQQ